MVTNVLVLLPMNPFLEDVYIYRCKNKEQKPKTSKIPNVSRETFEKK